MREALMFVAAISTGFTAALLVLIGPLLLREGRYLLAAAIEDWRDTIASIRAAMREKLLDLILFALGFLGLGALAATLIYAAEPPKLTPDQLVEIQKIEIEKRDLEIEFLRATQAIQSMRERAKEIASKRESMIAAMRRTAQLPAGCDVVDGKWQCPEEKKEGKK